MTEEDEEFNRIEREAKQRMESVKSTVSKVHQCQWPTCQSEGYQQALAEQIQRELVIGQQEPAGSVYRYGKDPSGTPWHGIHWKASGLDLPDGTLIYTSPPAQEIVCSTGLCHFKAPRPWVGLTDEELSGFDVDPVEAKLMIAKLKEKNHAPTAI